MVTGYHSTKSSLKNTRNPRLDELIDQVPLTRDPAEKKLALEAVVLAKNEYSVIATIYVPEVWAVSSKEAVGPVSTGSMVWETPSTRSRTGSSEQETGGKIRGVGVGKQLSMRVASFPMPASPRRSWRK